MQFVATPTRDIFLPRTAGERRPWPSTWGKSTALWRLTIGCRWCARPFGSKKFLTEHGLRILSKTGPPSGQSTTVTFTYEIVKPESQKLSAEEAWQSLRGALKDVYAEFGGGEAYLRGERASFRDVSDGE